MADDAYSAPLRARHPNTTTTAIERRRRRQTIAQQRKHMERALERLLAAVEAVVADLDALDGDADLEPSLGAPEAKIKGSELFGPSSFFTTILLGETVDQRAWARGLGDDLEDQHDGREPDVDDEHALGWAESESLAGRTDVALTSDENEPSLGSLGGCAGGHMLSQAQWAAGADIHLDLEEACDDEGVLDNEDACTCEDGVYGPSGEYTLGWAEADSRGVSKGYLSPGAADHEPSLGSCEQMKQTHWGGSLAPGRDGNDIDAEDEHDGREEETDQNTGDDEPDDYHLVPTYADDGDDQTRIVMGRFGDKVFYGPAGGGAR